MASKPAYMARLQESRVRRLPPMTPIREASTPGSIGTPVVMSQQTNTPRQVKPDVLKVDDFPEEYRYLVTRTPAADVTREKPREGPHPFVKVHHSNWHPEQVDAIVDHYLQSVSVGGNVPIEPQLPNTLCKCCSDINSFNKRKQLEKHTHAHVITPLQESERHQLPDTLKYKPITNEQSKGHEYSANYTIYRTESPELLSDSNHHSIPEYEQKMLDSRKIFVTHPAKKTLYSNWGVKNELETFGYDRSIAENVVQASSNFINAMEKLKKMGSDD